MTPAQRETIVNKLVADLVEGADRMSTFLWDVLKDGHKGISNYTDEELLEAHRAAFDAEFENDGEML